MATSTFYGNLVNYLVIPTENDHYGDGYGGVGAGMIPTELQFNPLVAAQSAIAGHVVSGFEPPASGTYQDPYVVADVTAGAATINGYRIVGTDTISVNLTASATNYLFLKLVLDGNDRVLNPAIHIDDASYTRPSNSIPLGEVTTDASSITATVDLRPQNKLLYGTVNGVTGDPLNRGSEGWSSSRSATGSYTLTISPAFFADTPFASVSPGSNAYGTIWPTSGSSVLVRMYDDTGSVEDISFTFFIFS